MLRPRMCTYEQTKPCTFSKLYKVADKKLESKMAGNFEWVWGQNFQGSLQISLMTNGSKIKQFMARNIVCHYTKNYNEEI